MKVIISGSHTITDYPTVAEASTQSGFPITEMVCGRAAGVERLREMADLALRLQQVAIDAVRGLERIVDNPKSNPRDVAAARKLLREFKQ